MKVLPNMSEFRRTFAGSWIYLKGLNFPFFFCRVDGQKVILTYIADENGYQPTGDHIPKIPVRIMRFMHLTKT